ncbi:MAG: DapH/DapD/GlmU-related protein [Candidatus Omnitrophota bacterium]
MKWLITTIVQLLFTLFMYVVGIFVIGLAIFPGLLLCVKFVNLAAEYSLVWQILAFSLGIAAAYFIYGLCLIFIVGIVRILFGLTLKEGEYPMASPGALKWALVNSLVLVVANTFMDFILITPFINLFYRLMGAKLGKNVQINSKFCADLSLLEIGDSAVIGGHATVIGHSFERGRLVLKKVKIGNRAVIGLNSVVLPGCQIGDQAMLAAGTVLGKNTIIEPRTVYCGVPGMSLKERRKNKSN